MVFKEKIDLEIYDKDKCQLFALGRNAMYAACCLLKLNSTDEVLTPAFDCDGALQPFSAVGCKLRFFKSDPRDFSVDFDDIRKKINKNTKLIHIINHFGISQSWDRLLALRQEVGIPILEDNAYSLFSSFNSRLLGTFGDFAVFSLWKNLPLLNGGMLRINNPAYGFVSQDKKMQWVSAFDYPDLLRILSRKLGLNMKKGCLKHLKKIISPYSDPPPPLYSDSSEGYPDWPLRDIVEKKFSGDYLRPMPGLARLQLSNIKKDAFIEISSKKRGYYFWLSEELKQVKGITVLWPQIPEGAVPFCLSVLIDSKRDIFLNSLKEKYSVMAWPIISKQILSRLKDFPEVEFLGKRLLQINLPADKVVSGGFARYLESLVVDIRRLADIYL